MPFARTSESTSPKRRRWPMLRFSLARQLLLSLVLLALSPVGAVLAADTRVDVELKDASGRLANGEVTLSLGSVSKSCRTVGGRCSITLAAGSYQVRLVPTNGATTTSQVSVPASGSIRLSLRITPATAATPTTPTTPAAPTVTADKRTATTQAGTVRAAGTTQAGTVRAAGTTKVPNLSSGRVMRVQGSVVDTSGRLANAAITIEQNGRTVGTAKCVGGRFSIFDLSPGTYVLRAVATDGRQASNRLTVKTTVLRPTVRLPAR